MINLTSVKVEAHNAKMNGKPDLRIDKDVFAQSLELPASFIVFGNMEMEQRHMVVFCYIPSEHCEHCPQKV